VIDYLRGYWREYDSAPMVRRLVKATGIPLQRIFVLFPAGPAQGACKIAGLPKPTGCV
jgi:tRNA 2-thiouridine synthesizing protein E